MLRLLILALLIPLSGCITTQERISNSCQSMGYDLGTEGFLACYQTLAAQDQERRAAWLALSQQGFAMAAQQPQQSNVVCTSNSMGSRTMPSTTVCQGY